MARTLRRTGALDRLIAVMDQGVRTIAGGPKAILGSGRPLPQPPPQPAGAATPPLEPAQQRAAAALMRVNHAGEVAAQALYHGQALIARDPALRAFLLHAAREEGDHLAWCERRLAALGARTSLLDPLWYAGSFGIGLLAGLAGDSLSLGFIAETERQVEGHLTEHLERLPAADVASRAVLEQMRSDEARHGLDAKTRGGTELPPPLPRLMRAVSRVMTRTAYWL